ncbi:hypothetical protein BG452_28560 [Streptomyces sp. CBMA123]|nr:hypothetical protein [Streptomyces sp. CBMA123]
MTARSRAGSSGSWVRVLWSIRDFTLDLDFLVAYSFALIGHGATQGTHRAGSVDLGGPLGEVLDQQVPDGPAFNAVRVDDLLDAAAALDAKRPKPQRCTGREHAGLLEQGVEQRPARAASEVGGPGRVRRPRRAWEPMV